MRNLFLVEANTMENADVLDIIVKALDANGWGPIRKIELFVDGEFGQDAEGKEFPRVEVKDPQPKVAR